MATTYPNQGTTTMDARKSGLLVRFAPASDVTTEIYGEGLRLPPVKLYSAGVLNADLERIIFTNVRTPDERRGDLRHDAIEQARYEPVGIGNRAVRNGVVSVGDLDVPEE